MKRNMERVLRDIGQLLRPMSEAPRDGTLILAHVAHGDGMMHCYWDASPQLLAGPAWVKAANVSEGFLDRHFSGWLAPASFSPLDDSAIADIVKAYVADASETRDEAAIRLLIAATSRETPS
jgi:hypothetical protein